MYGINHPCELLVSQFENWENITNRGSKEQFLLSKRNQFCKSFLYKVCDVTIVKQNIEAVSIFFHGHHLASDKYTPDYSQDATHHAMLQSGINAVIMAATN